MIYFADFRKMTSIYLIQPIKFIGKEDNQKSILRMRSDKIGAIVPAAGAGKRMGSAERKQFLIVRDRPVLAWTLAALQRISWLDHIILVVPEDKVRFVQRAIIEKYRLSKVTDILAGGEERTDSVYIGLQCLPADIPWVMIHDGVRPFIKEDLLRVAFVTAQESGNVILGVPVRDTLKNVIDQEITQSVARDHYWLIQTPQFFQSPLLQEVYQQAIQDKFRATDDAGIMEHYGKKVTICRGDYYNIKITSPEDLPVAERLLPLYFPEILTK
jgi:2-C-methyl-D-erythritol 4-phosphate cytidylyltransferase